MQMENGCTVMPDGSGFFVMDIDTSPEAIAAQRVSDPVKWNPFNKVVQDHRDGTLHVDATNVERALRGLPTPWTPEMADTEVHQAPVW